MSKLIFGKWQEKLDSIKSYNDKFELIFYDPPYEVTDEFWDVSFVNSENCVLDLLAPNGVIVVFGKDGSIDTLTRQLSFSNRGISLYYKWYWITSRKARYLQSKHKPLSQIEELSVFKRRRDKSTFYTEKPLVNILEYRSVGSSEKIHICQKPIDLCKFIIERYTKKGDWVLDICMGSGTIPQAAKLLQRNFIGVEMVRDFYVDAEHRLRHKSK